MLEFIIKLLSYIDKLHIITKLFFKHIPDVAGNYAVKYEDESAPDA
jgi:hypothetical protein